MRLFFAAVFSLAFSSMAGASDETIMKGGDQIYARDVSFWQNEMCQFSVRNDGNMVVKKINLYGDYDTMWHTAPDPIRTEPADYYLQLSQKGNLVIYKEYLDPDRDNVEPVYASSSKQSQDEYPEYSLVIDEECKLAIYEDGHEDDDPVWTNIKTELQPKERLNELEILRDEDCGAFMMLENDCELVIREGTDRSNRGKVLWSSGVSFNRMERDSFDCYAMTNLGGRLQVYAKPNPDTRANSIFDMHLDPDDIIPSGEFTVGLCDGEVYKPTANPL